MDDTKRARTKIVRVTNKDEQATNNIEDASKTMKHLENHTT